MPHLQSKGECLYCGEKFSKAAIHRHLQKHLTGKVKEGRPGKSFLLKVEAGPYFLSLWADGNAAIGEIDDLLRRIWLECCGHMSSFTNPKEKRGGSWNLFDAQDLLAKGKIGDYEEMMEQANGEIPMSRKTSHALVAGLKINYDYDFGSTTSLLLTVVGEYPVKADKKVLLLSRNEPLEILCEACGKQPAVHVCSVCMGYNESAFCKKCARKHASTCADFADYSSMPVVNSPRMGVCAYEGGIIDKQRDGVFVKR